MGKNKDNFKNENQPLVNQFMKFSEHFYTLYSGSPLDIMYLENEYILLIIFIINIPFIVFGFLNSFIHKSDLQLLLGLISLGLAIVVPIIIYLICLSCKKCGVSSARVDFIFSKDFDRIFVGKVNSEEDKYIKTFEYQINEIEKFFFQQNDSTYGFTTLKVVLKNKRIDEIQQCRLLDKFDQDGIEYILNGKLNN